MARVVGKTSVFIDQLISDTVVHGEITDGRRLIIRFKDGTVQDLGPLGPKQEQVDQATLAAEEAAKGYARSILDATAAEIEASIASGNAATRAYARAQIDATASEIEDSIESGNVATRQYAVDQIATSVEPIAIAVDAAQAQADAVAADIIATNSRLDGVVSAVSGSALVTLESSVSNPNSTFNEWPSGNAAPTGYALWANGVTPSVTKNTTDVLTGAYSAQFSLANANDQRGLSFTPNNMALGVEYVTVYLDVLLKSGTFSGAGILLDWAGMSGAIRAFMPIASQFPSPQLNKWYRLSATLKRPSTATGTQTGYYAWAMANYADLGGLTQKNIVFDRVGVRPATALEIYAYEANGTSSIVNGWKATGTTKIDGGQLENDSVKTGQLDAQAITSKFTITGATFQTEATSNRGIKINSLGLVGYSATGSPQFTLTTGGALSLTGPITTGGTTTAGVFQTEGTASRGIKFTSTGIVGYDTSGVPQFTLTSAGALTLSGPITTGGTSTASVFQTEGTASRGIKFTSVGIVGYDTSGVPQFTLTSAGALTLSGPLVTGGTITGATLQTTPTASRGVKMTAAGLYAYNGSGLQTFSLEASTGNVSFTGTINAGSTITGATVRTSATGTRVQLANSPSDRLEFYNSSNGLQAFIGGATSTSSSLMLYSSVSRVLLSGPGGSASLGGISNLDMVGRPTWYNDAVSYGGNSQNYGTFGTGGSLEASWTRMLNQPTNRALWIYGDGVYSAESTLTVGTPFYGSQFVVWSDQNDKSDQQPLTGALADLRQVTAYDYDTKHGGAKGSKQRKSRLVRRRGLMAQDVEKVGEHLIHDERDDESTGFGLGVDVYGLLATTIAALQELDHEVTVLREQLNRKEDE